MTESHFTTELQRAILWFGYGSKENGTVPEVNQLSSIRTASSFDGVPLDGGAALMNDFLTILLPRPCCWKYPLFPVILAFCLVPQKQ